MKRYNTQDLLYYVLNNIIPHNKILLAYSGGLDSTVLLDILSVLRKSKIILNNYNICNLTIRAIYINHGLNIQANNWSKHCMHQCLIRNINFNTINVFVNCKKSNIESSARYIRYKTLIYNLKQNEVLLTAHHQNDQAETFLLALKRGSGPAGLSSMLSNRLLYGKNVIRPFLNLKKSSLRIYANQKKLNWIEDNNNYNLSFDRNFLRLRILPLLYKRWPFFAKTVSRSAKLCLEQENLLNELLQNELSSLIYSDNSLIINKFILMNRIKCMAILRRWLLKCHIIYMPSFRQLTNLYQHIIFHKSHHILCIQFNNYQIRKFRNRLYVLPILKLIKESDKKIIWPISSLSLVLPSKLGILYRKIPNDVLFSESNIPFDKEIACVRAPYINEEVSIQFRKINELIYIEGEIKGLFLKDIWKKFNIPPWKRSITPMLFYNNIFIAALGIFVTKKGASLSNSNTWKIFLQTENNFKF